VTESKSPKSNGSKSALPIPFDQRAALHLPRIPEERETDVLEAMASILIDGMKATTSDGKPDHETRLRYLAQANATIGSDVKSRTEVMAQVARLHETERRHEEAMARIDAEAKNTASHRSIKDSIFTARDAAEMSKK